MPWELPEVMDPDLARAGWEELQPLVRLEESIPDVICRNPQEVFKDAATREAILDKLKQTIEKQGPKAVIGNRDYARFLKVAKGSASVDEAAVKRDARLDGMFVLTTNIDLPTAEVAQTYKSLWRV